MTVADCARLVERGDPARFMAAMAAPVEARAVLFPLYAYNLELARAPWLTAEPMIAQMRLQWWRDAVGEAAAGDVPKAHEVMVPLAALIRRAELPGSLLDAMAEARGTDLERKPFATDAALFDYLDVTAGGLMWAGALALGAGPEAEKAVRGIGVAGGLAAWLQAVPDLIARGREPLPDGGGVAALARQGLERIARARAARATVPKTARATLLAAWQAEPLLRRAAASPAAVAEGGLQLSEFARRGRLLWQATSGRW